MDNTLNGDIISFTVNLDNMKPQGFIISRKRDQLMISIMFYSSSGEMVWKTKMKEIGLNGEGIAVIFLTPLSLKKNHYSYCSSANLWSPGPTYYCYKSIKNCQFRIERLWGTLKVPGCI